MAKGGRLLFFMAYPRSLDRRNANDISAAAYAAKRIVGDEKIAAGQKRSLSLNYPQKIAFRRAPSLARRGQYFVY
jgi:hypothetical protein